MGGGRNHSQGVGGKAGGGGGYRNRSQSVGGKAGGGGGKGGGGGGGGKNRGGARNHGLKHHIENLDPARLARPVEDFLAFIRQQHPLLLQPDGVLGDVDEFVRQVYRDILLVHPMAAADSQGVCLPCSMDKDSFNGFWPCSKLADTDTGGGILVGGIEAPAEVGHAHDKRVNCVVECRNNAWSTVRQRTAPTAEEYRRVGVDYYQYDVNASLRKSRSGQLSSQWSFFTFVKYVLEELLAGRLVLLHCASLVVGLARAPGRAVGRL